MKAFLNKYTLSLALMGISISANAGTRFEDLLNDPAMWMVTLAIVFVLLALMAISKALNTMKDFVAEKRMADQPEAITQPKEEESFIQKLTDSVPVEREAEVMLDHDYDGIKELDNNLPPWWVWGFVITIIWAVGYMLYFHVLGGPGQIELYEREMAEAEAKVEAYLATSPQSVDESNVEVLTDEKSLTAGTKIYQQNCVACHMADGGGMVGPNLTDDYWIHGGTPTDVYKIIKNGVPEKGMIPWKDQLSPVQIQQVTSFIMEKLVGTTPASPKEPEGEKIES